MNPKNDFGRQGIRVNFGTALWVGFMGGLFLSVRDCITVLVNHAPHPFALSRMLAFSGYPVLFYILAGCAVMVLCGALLGLLMRIGGYAVSKEVLTGLYAGIFISLAVSVIGTYRVGLEAMKADPTTIIEITVASILCGLVAGGLFTYLWGRTTRPQRFSLCISLTGSALLFVYTGLWININLLPEFWKPVSLASDAGLLLLSCLWGMGLYILSFSFIERKRPGARRERVGAIIVLASVASVLFVIALAVNMRSGHGKRKHANNRLPEVQAVPMAGLRDRPNILWIVMDTVRADHLSGYGYSRKTTPGIDKIARQGALFENAISAAPWTLPSHASMFTGMYAGKHKANGEHLFLADDFMTIAEILHRNGYKTLGYSNNPFVSEKTNLDQGFETFEYSDWGKRRDLNSFLMMHGVTQNIKNLIGAQDKGAGDANRHVMEWITDCQDSGAPFFIFINYVETHLPYTPPRPYAARYLDRKEARTKAKKVNKDPYAYIAGKVQMGPEDFEILGALYDGELSYLDSRIHQLSDFLARLGILDKTLVIITSDHGENIGDHRLMDHVFCLYDTLLHVPLIVRYPKVFLPGSRIPEQVQTTDIMPTVLDILGLSGEGTGEMAGRSLAPTTRERQPDPSAFAISEHSLFPLVLSSLNGRNFAFDASVYARRMRSIRTRKFKYIQASDGRVELYNLETDPGERNNLIGRQPEKAAEFKAILEGLPDASGQRQDQEEPTRERNPVVVVSP